MKPRPTRDVADPGGHRHGPVGSPTPRQRSSAARLPLAAVALAAVILASATGACGGARNSLGTSASPCFRALPLAEAAVHEEGRLVGVRRVNTSTLRRRIKNSPTLEALPNQELCVFAFRGHYAPGKVDGVTNPRAARYAIIAVSSRHPAVVAAFVDDRLPTRFAHLR